MATLIGTPPLGLTFNDLVGSAMRNTPLRPLASAERDQAGCEHPMQVYLPDGVVREMTLTDDQGFLVSYRITNVRQAVDVMNRSREEEIQGAKGTICETPALDRQVQDHIGQQLQGMYEQLLAEPVPGHLLMLLARLERQDRAQSDDR